MDTKRCSRGDKCLHPDGPDLPLSEFYKDKTHRDGYRAECKKCRRNYNETHREDMARRQREYYARHQEYYRAYANNRYATNDEYRARKITWGQRNPEKQRAIHRDYYYRNREKRLEGRRQWGKRNPSYGREYYRRYSREHPEIFRAIGQRRRALKRGAKGSHTAEDLMVIYKSQKGKCYWCQKPVGDKYHVDHRIPLVKGGSNDASNLVISCPTCNLSKRDKMPWEFNGRLL